MAKGIKFTQKEDNIVIDAISKYPTNLNYAFEYASSKLVDRSAKGVSQRYYQHLKKTSNALMATGSSVGVMVNTKNTKRIGRLKPSANLKNKMIITALSQFSKEKTVLFFLDNLSDKDKITILNKIISNI